MEYEEKQSKKKQFAQLAAGYYQQMADESCGFEKTHFERLARNWKSGAYENKCIGCLAEDCCCCSFYLEGSKSEMQEILSQAQTAILKQLKIIESLQIK